MLQLVEVEMGCDPEGFITRRNNHVVGSEKIVPKVSNYKYNKVTIDGVQFEINPEPAYCRAAVANGIKLAMRNLHYTLQEKNLQISTRNTVTVPQKELDSLSEESKRFGCAPSRNIGGSLGITVDPKIYRKRSAGGHLHFGRRYRAPKPGYNWDLFYYGNLPGTYYVERQKVFVGLLDLVVANTFVLFDRDRGNIERRKHYGRAGEYRLPKHGLEYRTLSNVWLLSYPLMSFAFGMARWAFCILYANKHKELLDLVPRNAVEAAINRNDRRLARRNFDTIKDTLLELVHEPTPTYDRSPCPLTKDSLPLFEHFLSKPLKYWFKHDPLVHWANLPETHYGGWDSFLRDFVGRDLGGGLPTPMWKNYAYR